jgi:hypothetical protein
MKAGVLKPCLLRVLDDRATVIASPVGKAHVVGLGRVTQFEPPLHWPPNWEYTALSMSRTSANYAFWYRFWYFTQTA